MIEVNNIKYDIVKNYRDAFDKDEFIEKFTDYFNDYDYIVGDIAYCALSFANDDYKYIIIYGTLLICAIYGCVKNHKLYNKKFHETSC